MAPGFCTCTRDFPGRRSFHPPEHATWHYLCDKPVLPPAWPCCPHCDHEPGYVHRESCMDATCPGGGADSRPEFTEASPIPADPPEYEPDDAEAQRIAEVFAEARAELDRGL